MAHTITLKRRRHLLEQAANNRRAIDVLYDGETSCCTTPGKRRTWEIHNIQTSQAGNVVIDAYCRQCDKRERFRLDRIISHRVLRGRPAAYQGPAPKVRATFTLLGHVPDKQRLRAPITSHTTAETILEKMRESITWAARFPALHGDDADGTCRTRPVNRGDRCPRCRPVYKPRPKKPEPDAATVDATFTALTQGLSTPQEQPA